jgi:hypothetical protein
MKLCTVAIRYVRHSDSGYHLQSHTVQYTFNLPELEQPCAATFEILSFLPYFTYNCLV